MKIYVVTQGCYSDYHIITATTDEKLAYDIRDRFNGVGWDKAEVEVFKDAEIFLKPCYFIRFNSDGNVSQMEERLSAYDYGQSSGIDMKGDFYTHVVADDAVAAIKIGSERRAMYLAQKAGVC